MEKIKAEDVCKYCDSDNIEYNTYERVDSNLLAHEYMCKACGVVDANWYELKYIGKNE